VLHYDEQGQLVRREESSRLDGRLDTSTVYAQGRPERKESDTDDDGKPDVWATYTADGKVSVLESLMADGRRLRQRYTEGKVTREEWRTADALVTARDLDASGTVVREEEFGAGGRLSSVTFYESGRLVRRELYQVDERLFKRVPLVSSGGTGTP
jgi:antitoxin component YwqK of YwqJK toxin-antitoxin module